MDKNYWENYYKDSGNTRKPSPFAEWVFEYHLKKDSSLIELGCGNGRDSIFFAQQGINVLAVDQCVEEINALASQVNHPNIKFLAGDFTNLKTEEKFDAIYSRFTLHSITEEDENNVLDWIKNNLKSDGKLLIEARGHKNEIYKLGEPVENQPHAYIYENHYRRFVELKTLNRKLMERGFNIELSTEEKGFAPYNGTNYTFIRVVATI